MGFTAWHALVKSDWFIWFLLLVALAVAWAYPMVSRVLQDLYFDPRTDAPK
ncbi:MAG: hypothetical protein AB1439_00075 [candidate division FCPU426 bacterium]